MVTKTLLVTGVCIDGIGYQVCKHILNLQKVSRKPEAWHIILAQRDPRSDTAKRAQTSLEQLSATVESRVTSYTCDLADFASVRRFASNLSLNEVSELDVVVLNAGIVANHRQETIDGQELNYQVNHLGHFLLVTLLQERIRERVIFVGSSLHKTANADQTLRTLEVDDQDFKGMRQYAKSKLLTAYCLGKWHEILSKRSVKVIIASPGFVPASGLSRDNSFFARFAMKWILHYLPVARTTSQAGETLMALAIGEEWAHLDNCYTGVSLKSESMHEDVYNQDHAESVWQWSRRACGLQD